MSLYLLNKSYLVIKNELLIKPLHKDVPYNFSTKTKEVDVDGQGQPLIINNRIFRNRIKNGFYIEAGAFDGEIRSNSLFYELKKGWNGLLVEPNPDAFEKLKQKVI